MSCLVWFGLIWCLVGPVSVGLGWFGLGCIGFGSYWFWFVLFGVVCCGVGLVGGFVCLVWPGVVLFGLAWSDFVWSGLFFLALAWSVFVLVGLGWAWPGLAWF